MTATRLSRIPVVLALLLAAAGPSAARIMKAWSYDGLIAESDVVAIVESVENVPAKDIAPFASDNRPSTDFAATNTRFRVAAMLKENGEPFAELTVLHFNYARSFPHVNGANFIRFPITETTRAINALRTPVWLAFLKRREDGRFEPVTGHYDSALSFRELHRPPSHRSP